MDNKKRFGVYMQQKRKEAGLTQKSFAQKLYISESAVSKWERGVTYPDLSLIRDICEILDVSEHELLTASEDTTTRTNEKLAKDYLELQKRYKWILSLVYGATLVICLFLNLSATKTVSWFYIVLSSVLLLASITLLPVLVNKNRELLTLAGFTVSLLLLLYVCNRYSNGNWFKVTAISTLFSLFIIFSPYILSNIGLPEGLVKHKAALSLFGDSILLFVVLVVVIPNGELMKKGMLLALFWLVVPWAMLVIIRYTKINNFFKTSACIGVISLVWFLNSGFTAMVVGGEPLFIEQRFNIAIWHIATIEARAVFLSLLGLMFAFSVAGIGATFKNKKVIK